MLRLRPKYVLELGSGLSSIVLGYAAKRLSESGSPCVVHSWEESADYFADLEPLIPGLLEPYLQRFVSHPVEQAESLSWVGLRFPDKALIPYDLVFVDGPEYPEWNSPQSSPSRYFDADVLDALDQNPNPFIVMIDGRRQTVAALRELHPYGVWRYGRMNPMHPGLPKQNLAFVREGINKALVFAFGGSALPGTFKFWFVPNAPLRHSSIRD